MPSPRGCSPSSPMSTMRCILKFKKLKRQTAQNLPTTVANTSGSCVNKETDYSAYMSIVWFYLDSPLVRLIHINLGSINLSISLCFCGVLFEYVWLLLIFGGSPRFNNRDLHSSIGSPHPSPPPWQVSESRGTKRPNELLPLPEGPTMTKNSPMNHVSLGFWTWSNIWWPTKCAVIETMTIYDIYDMTPIHTPHIFRFEFKHV